mgnify:CR=1 FL=1
MYNDPRHIRKNAVKVSLNDDEAVFLDKAAELAGSQKCAYIRELALEKLKELMEQDQDQRHSA